MISSMTCKGKMQNSGLASSSIGDQALLVQRKPPFLQHFPTETGTLLDYALLDIPDTQPERKVRGLGLFAVLGLSGCC